MATSLSKAPQRRSGFTLVELLVVITIIGILMGLLIPAVNAARETARRNQCSTQINNLALAAFQYELSHKSFPGYLQDYGLYANSGVVDPSDPENTTVAAVPHRKLGSWVVALLPGLEQQSTYEHWTQDKYPIVVAEGGNNRFATNAAPNLPIMQCPSSPSIDANVGRNSYVANCGLYNLTSAVPNPFASPFNFVQRSNANTIAGDNSNVEVIDFENAMKKDNGVFNNKYSKSANGFPAGPAIKQDDLKDGLSNTVLFSENLQAVAWNQVHPVENAAIGLVATLSSSNQCNFNLLSQLSQGFVWHYRDMKGKSFNGSTAVDGTTPFVVPEINGAIGTEDIFLTRMTAGNAHLVARPSSAHNDGVNMGFADRSSRFVAQSIDYRVYQALMTPRGKSSDVPFREFVPQGEAL